MNKIEIGCWVDTPHGPAVCVGIKPSTSIPDYFLCVYRYEANPWVNGSFDDSITMWVLNAEYIQVDQNDKDQSKYVTYLGPKDDTTAVVVEIPEDDVYGRRTA